MDFEQLRDRLNTHGPYYKRLGIRVEEIGSGWARVTKSVTDQDLNPLRFPHGGVYFSMADTACGAAAATHGRKAVTLDASYHFLRSAQVGDTLTAMSQEVKTGRTILVYDVRITNQEGMLLGSGTFTFYRLDDPIDL